MRRLLVLAAVVPACTPPTAPRRPAAPEGRSLARLPASRALASDADAAAHGLRSRVGERLEGVDPTRFALGAARTLCGLDSTKAAIPSAAELLASAARTGGWTMTGVPHVGDLVVFAGDAERGDAAEPLLGVVVDQAENGAVELVFLARGIVRRGFVSPQHPSDKRDDAGRIRNTFILAGRPGDGHEAQYLAGTLWRGYLRLPEVLEWLASRPGEGSLAVDGSGTVCATDNSRGSGGIGRRQGLKIPCS